MDALALLTSLKFGLKVLSPAAPAVVIFLYRPFDAVLQRAFDIVVCLEEVRASFPNHTFGLPPLKKVFF